MRFETLRRLRYLAKRGDWAFSFDLQDGYYALGLREDVRDYFTINVALRLRAEIERVWGRLGMAKHPTKAHPEPTQQLQHLSLDLDMVAIQFRTPAAKLRRLSNLARDLMCIVARRRRRHYAPAKLLASLAGQGQFLSLAMPPTRFYLREAHAVMGRCSSSSGKVVLTRQLIRDLEWWRDVPTRHNGAPILPPVETAYLHTDSSQYGWGAVLCETMEARGYWYEEDRRRHITYKELKAVRLAIQSFLPRLMGRRVLLYEDNQAVSHILSN
eukprot:jgi/Tetstr1/449393/TSEL_036488.t1